MTLSTCRLLVTDGETRAALACVRALAARGHAVHVASVDGRSLAGASRYAASDHPVGDGAAHPEKWVQAVERAVDATRAELILPLSEVALGNTYAFDLGSRCPVACPSRDAYEAATDKHALLERAQALGLDVPRGILVEPDRQLSQPTELLDLPDALTYPVVVKPRRSRWLEAGRWKAGEARIVTDADELRRAASAAGAGALIQEYVPGHGEAIFLLTSQGRALARFAHRRLREKPPTGGVSVLRESIEPDPELLAASERLLADLGWTGVAMVEFRRTPEGRAVLMELNPRLWGSVQLAVDAGVDFPSLLVALQRGESIPSTAAKIGVRTRWLLGDLDHLLIGLRRPRVRELTGRGVPRLIGDFLRSFRDGSGLEVLRRDDWRPFLRELRTWWAGET